MHTMPDGKKMPGKMSDMKGRYGKAFKKGMAKKMDGKGGPGQLPISSDSIAKTTMKSPDALSRILKIPKSPQKFPTVAAPAPMPQKIGPLAPTPSPGTPGGADPSQMMIGNQDPLRPGAAGSDRIRLGNAFRSVSNQLGTVPMATTFGKYKPLKSKLP